MSLKLRITLQMAEKGKPVVEEMIQHAIAGWDELESSLVEKLYPAGKAIPADRPGQTWLTWELPICEGNTMVKFLMNTQELALQRGFTISCGGNHREQIYRILKELS